MRLVITFGAVGFLVLALVFVFFFYFELMPGVVEIYIKD